MSTLSDFLAEQGPRLATERVGARDLYSSYKAYALARDEGALPENTFSERVRDAGLTSRRDERGIYYGIGRVEAIERVVSGDVDDPLLEGWLADHNFPVPWSPGWDENTAPDPRFMHLSGWYEVSCGVRLFHRAYADWVTAQGGTPLPEKAFNAILRARGYRVEKETEAAHWEHLGAQYTVWPEDPRVEPTEFYVVTRQRWLADARRSATLNWGVMDTIEEYVGPVADREAARDTFERVAREHVAAHGGYDGCDWSEACEADHGARFRAAMTGLAAA